MDGSDASAVPDPPAPEPAPALGTGPDEPTSATGGMGPVQRGPAFAAAWVSTGPTRTRPAAHPSGSTTSWSLDPRDPAAAEPGSVRPSAGPGRARDPGQRRANLIGIGAILLVALVTAIGTLVARNADRHVTPRPSVSVAVVPVGTADPSRTAFTTGSGTGRLVMLDHSWHAGGQEPATHGEYLEIRVEIICDSGVVDYDPYSFQTFDADGELYDVAALGVTGTLIGAGELHPGESTTGSVAFDLPRGGVMLLMSDDTDHSITALKVPD